MKLIDLRPQPEYNTSHIPGALNRPFSEDLATDTDPALTFKPNEVLAAAYAAMIPSQGTEVIVHCRTGHQASQTYFVLKHLLGYKNVRWYDAGWTEWAARPEFPIE